MWALRRASNPLKRGSVLRSARALFVDLGKDVENQFGMSEYCVGESNGCVDLKRFYHTREVPGVFSVWRRELSSEPFSELESNTGENSAPEPSDVDDNEESSQNELEVSDVEAEEQPDKTDQNMVPSKLAPKLVASNSIHEVLDKWVGDGNDLNPSEIYTCMIRLRKLSMFWKALKLSEWLESNKRLEFGESDYVNRVNLIAKVRGAEAAERYIRKIPESFRGDRVYQTLLANCALSGNVKKAEEVFNRMKELQFPLTIFSFNNLLLLYKRMDKKKIGDVLLLMEKEIVKPNPFTYKILIDAKGQFNDITGMDQIVETMKAQGMEPDLSTQSVLARHYLYGGLKEKALNVLKEMEGGNLKEHRGACKALLPLYGELGKADEVERVWKLCETGPRRDECMAAIEAYGKLKNVEKAEEVFKKMSNTWKRLSSKHYSVMLKVYIKNKMFDEGMNMVKRMTGSGCQVDPLTWDALVQFYVEAGEVERADLILQKAIQKNKLKPLYNSFITIMDQYAKIGDIHNAEKIFYKMKRAGYSSRLRQFQTLVKAYVNANSPAYGIRERMKADNLFPDKALAAQLNRVATFRRTAISNLID